jgi:hypothetical protein
MSITTMSAEIESGYISTGEDLEDDNGPGVIEYNDIDNNDIVFLSKDAYIQGLKATSKDTLSFCELISAVTSIYGTNEPKLNRYSYIMDKHSQKYISEYELDTIMECLLSTEGVSLGYRIAMEPEFSSRLSFYYNVSNGDALITLKE